MEEMLFNRIVTKLTERFREEVLSLSEEYKNLDTDSIIHPTIQNLILIIVSPLIKEMHQLKDEQKLDGQTPEAQYQYFDKYFSKECNLQAFFRKYPLIEKKIKHLLDCASRNIHNIFERLQVDRDEIKSILNVAFENDDVESVKFSMGDTHNFGQSVAIIYTRCGNIVYKPHSLENEVFFNSFLQTFNQKINPKSSLVNIRSINKHDYGWQEFVPEVFPESEQDKKEYYYNLGSLAAIAYCLTLTDIHYDNILVSGISPVFYDIETLFSADPAEAYHPNMINSILNTSIFPVNKGVVFKNVDVSGLFGHYSYKEQSFDTMIIKDEFTSNMRIITDEIILPKKTEVNEKMLNMDPLRYISSLLEGFKDSCKHIINSKEIIVKFIQDNISHNNLNRVILRDTQVYMEFLMASLNANYLTDETVEQQLFDILLNNKSPIMTDEIVLSEISQLKNGDVPYFYHPITDLNLYSCYDCRFENFFKTNVVENVIRFIRHLTDADITFQTSIIKKSIMLAVDPLFTNDPLLEQGYVTQFQPKSIVTRKQAIQICDRYVERILNENLFYTNDNNLNLLQLKLFPESTVQGMDYDLYEGLGVLLTVAYYAKVREREDLLDTVKQIYNQSFSRFKFDLQRDKITVSLYSGIGSLIYVSANLYQVTQNRFYREKLDELLNISMSLLSHVTNIDYIDGLSGFIVLIRKLKGVIKTPILKPLLAKACTQLVRMAETCNITDLGYAHGQSGIAYALSIAYNVLLEPRILEQLIGWFENWNEVYANQLDEENNSWCRGRPGFYLAIFQINKELEIVKRNHDRLNESMGSLLHNAIDNLIRIDFTMVNGASLCHGLAGNIQILRSIAKTDNLPAINVKITELQAQMVSFIEQYGKIPLGQLCEAECIDGFMLGSTGVIYELLTMIDNRIPLLFDVDYYNLAPKLEGVF